MGDDGHGSGSHLDFVVNMVNTKLDGLEDPYQGHNSIFKAPQTLLQLYPTLLIPQVVSIGPYHHSDFPETDKHKAQFLLRVMERTGRSMTQLVNSMLEIEDVTRWSYIYVKDKDFEPAEFVTMMLLDGCFILELFNVSYYGHRKCGYPVDDPIFNFKGIYPFIQRDLLMLENQIPLCVLDKLFPYTWPESNPPAENLRVTDLALKFFNSNSIIPKLPPSLQSCIRQPLHLLDMVGLFLMRARTHDNNQSGDGKEIVMNILTTTQTGDGQEIVMDSETIETDDGPEIVMHSVTTLGVVGVKFVQKADPRDFMDIEFDAKKGVLKIPKLQIQELTKHIFLNLMAFEHYYPRTNSHLTSYIVFMAGLIHTTEDVEQLRHNGIVEYWSGGDDHVVHLFNNLRKEVVFNTRDYYLSSVSVDLHRRFKSKWHNFTAKVKREYFQKGALAVVTLLFFATLAQTVFTILAYYLPPK